MFEYPSIAEIAEPIFVQQLCAQPHNRSRIEPLGVNADAHAFLQVPLAGVPQREFEGDIDILFCDPHQPDLATAIEVKRIKVSAEAFRWNKPNKLQEFEKGVQQANRLARAGFHQVYFYVFVVVDSRENNAGQVSYAGLSNELRDVINRVIRISDKLEPRVGLHRYEFVQPMDYPPFRGTFHASSVRNAQPITQSADLTQWVAQVLAQHAPFPSDSSNP